MNPSEVLRRAKIRAVGRNWLPFEAIRLEGGGETEERLLKQAIVETVGWKHWTHDRLQKLLAFDHAIALAEAEE